MDDPEEGVSFTKRDEPPAEPSADPAAEAEFDPYRFGKPEHPIPAEYAPPGYTGPTIPAAPAGPANPYSSPTGNPFANPPGTPYGAPYGAQPPGNPYGPPYGPPPPYGAPPPYGYPYDPSAPPPPQFHAYPQPQTGNGKAIAGLVLGILSILLCLLSVFDLLFLIPGLVFSLIALGETKNGHGSGRGIAVAGLVCTIVGAVLATLITIVYVRVGDKCDGLQDQRSEFQHCVRHNIF